MTSLIDTVWVKLGVVILAIISPWICLFSIGELDSYSQYWSTDMRPLFIFTNAATSYFLFSMKNWWMSAVCLMLLTAFSFDQYNTIHNVTAIAFFLINGVLLLKQKRFRYLVIPYFSSVIILFLFGIYWAEVLAISVICTYHYIRLLTYNKLERLRKNR
jgi:hypothetical protein